MSTVETTKVHYRLATAPDAPGIFAVLEEVAPKIPVRLDGQQRKELLFARIQGCCCPGESWVAVGCDEQIVGFLLAEPDKLERFYNDNLALHLP
jgi:hypothetical protein